VTRSSHRGHYGNAILTRLPVESQLSVPIGIDGREPRGVLQAVLRAGDESVSVINTHLGLRDHERRIQIVRVAALIGECNASRSIVLGDFNEWTWRAAALAPIVSHMGRQASLRTFPSWWPLFALDRIWARAPARIVTLEVVRTALTRRASDHLPIRARVEL
jgi:endonuclease/exonuclease/phosphatase family metal-dependent hydrolase